jgi:diacylglycerol kinase (ATP)
LKLWISQTIGPLNKKIAILYNSKAGKGKAVRLIVWLQAELNERRLQFEIFADRWPTELDSYTDAWIVGGDGTLNYFINKYPHCKLPLFIYRGGTGNDFAWKLYGNKKPEDCLQVAIEAPAKKVDAGTCNGRFFINGVGIGFDGEIVRSMQADKFLFRGHSAYYAAVLRKIFSFREAEVKIQTQEISWRMYAFMVTIANGSRYGGGFLVAPDAQVDDGRFDIVVIPKISLMQRLLLLPGADKGKHLRIATTTRSGSVIVNADKIIAAHLDGEAIESDNFEIDILPGKFLFRY